MARVFGSVQLLIFCLATVLVLTKTVLAQEATPVAGNGNPELDPVVRRNIEDWAIQQRGFVDDWTHHHLVFTNPGTEQDALSSGNYEQWLSIVNEPRFTLQQMKRSAGTKLPEGMGALPASIASAEVSEEEDARDRMSGGYFVKWKKKRKHPLKKDWSVAIGGVAASGIGTVTTNTATGTSTVTVNGQTLTA